MMRAINSDKGSDIAVSIGLTVVILFFIITTIVAYWNTSTISNEASGVTHTHETIAALNQVLSSMKDVETGQRGYVITGDDKYLAPYNAALPRIDEEMVELEKLLKDSPDLLAKLPLMRKHIDAKLAELKQTIELRKTQGFDAAHAVVITDHGKNEMDEIRGLMQEITDSQVAIRNQRLSDMESSFRVAVLTGVLAGLIGLLITLAVNRLYRRVTLNQRKQDWLTSGQVILAEATYGELRIDEMGANILKLLADYMGAQAGAFFVREEGRYVRAATYGVPVDSKVPEQFGSGDGLLGQAARENKPFAITDVPENYLYFGSALGQAKPTHLLIFPLTAEKRVNAVIELGFTRAVDPLMLELLTRISETVGMAVRSVAYRTNLQNLLEETQRQSEELQTQSEELKVSNEELEEQSRALRESQARLEQQQVEMEQTNSQLEEQTQMLEAQRRDLEQSKLFVQQKADELEKASQYKSNFLANMSHELRTPLNSSLILAKLLADNSNGNLTHEQVLHARTIQSAGNDLLTLINDILDLSKIEAGHMEIHVDTVSPSRLTNDLNRIFEPVAKSRGLEFRVSVAPGCPESFSSDRQRLEQVLRNLIANAMKFTEHGHVELAIKPAATTGMLALAVTDTGIGISHDQQEAIFDAFRQADGTISRKYGGTGLGLSISRELTRLLGGHIELASEPGKGSTFSVVIPEQYDAKKVQPATRSFTEPTPVKPAAKAVKKDNKPLPPSKPGMADDRDKLQDGKRTLMVIEDDEPFAHILYELAHELDFQCILAANAEEGLLMARQYMPSAVLLDVGLPDNSGLTVLDRMKHDARMRHIPVHVISGSDYSQTALSLGAASYMLKPVKRDELTDALRRVETRFAQHVRRVLIVEDDKVQRESVKKLLTLSDIETVAVGTAAACLERLKEGVFDCMVLDLSLPDASGYSLLETLSKEDAYSFPPVIVYTGRDLSADEEQKLRRFSKSIIIKGAKSPERLLDEVTLFLHQVVSELPPEQQKMLEKARSREAALEGKNVLIVEDDVRNVYSLTSILEPQGVKVHIARNGREGLEKLEKLKGELGNEIDLVLMDVMMPEMDGLTATREIRKKKKWKDLPIIMLTAKAMKDDQERCLEAGANDYMAKPVDVEKLLSLVRVWMPR